MLWYNPKQMLGLVCCTHAACKTEKCQLSFPICDALVRSCLVNFLCCCHNFVLLATAKALPKFLPFSTLLQLFSPHTRLYSTRAVEKRSGRAQYGKFGRLFAYLWWNFDFCTDSCCPFHFSTFTLPKYSIKFVEKRIHVEFERSRWFVNPLLYKIFDWNHRCIQFWFEIG